MGKPRKPKTIGPYEVPVDWAPDFKWAPDITFKAEGYVKWMKKVFPAYTKLPNVSDPIDVGELQCGTRVMPLYVWESAYASMNLPSFMTAGKNMRWERSGLTIVKGTRIGKVRFTKAVKVPVLFRPGGRVVMSLTPNEILTQRAGVRKAKGKVLIGGLGMGWFAHMVQNRTQVKDMVIVEKEKAVIKQFNTLKDVKVVHGDAFEYALKHGQKFDRILFDVWDGYGTAEYHPEWRKVKEKVGAEKCWGWGDVKTLPNGR